MLQERYISSEQQARLQERDRPSGQCRSASSSVVCQGLALDCSDRDTAHLKSPLWGDTEGHDIVEHKGLKTCSYSLRSRTLTMNRYYDIEYLRLTDVLPVQFAAYQSFI